MFAPAVQKVDVLGHLTKLSWCTSWGEEGGWQNDSLTNSFNPLLHLPSWHLVYINGKNMSHLSLFSYKGGGDLWPPSLCLALKNWYHMLGSQSPLCILYYHWQCEFGGYHPCWPFSMWDATFWLHCPLIENICGGCCLYEDTCHCHKLWNEGKVFKKLILH